MIATWPDFLVQLTRLLDGEEVSNSNVTPATLQQIISLGEKRVYREVRCRWNEKAFTAITTAGNLAALPSDYESPSIVHFGSSALQPASEEFVIDNARISQLKYFAQAGNSLTFAGRVSDGAVLQGRYYCRLPALSATTLPTNDFFLNEHDLFMYACLSKAAPFYDQDARIPVWEAQYVQLRDTLNTSHNRAAYSAGRLQRRPSARTERLPDYGLPTDVVTSSSGTDILDGGSA